MASTSDPALHDPYSDPENPRVVTCADVEQAMPRVAPAVKKTPCIKSHISDLVKSEIYLKQEFLQYTGSFKERGVSNTLALLPDEKKANGVMATSAGNHAQALSYIGVKMGLQVTVVMPVYAPIMKISKCRKYGAEVIIEGNTLQESKDIAMRLAYKKGATYVNGYDNYNIIAGQGTAGLEILEQVPDLDVVVIPVGGGSLIAGISAVMKEKKPNVKIIGVESYATASFAHSIKHGKPTYMDMSPTLADGLSVPMIGCNSFATCSKIVDKMVQVTEEWIAIAILRLIELEKCVCEGAGACALAAVLCGKLKEYQGKKIVLLLSGGNIDSTVLGRVVDRGLAADGRLIKFNVIISDRPGGLSDLLKVITEQGVSIKDIIPERAWVSTDVYSVKVKCVCETRDYKHALELKRALENKYTTVNFADFPKPDSSKLAVPLF